MTTDSARRRFNEMVLPHLDDAYGLARWLTGNRTDAEDVVQDAYMRALASLETAVVEQPRAWVLTIVRNTTFSWLAKNRPKGVPHGCFLCGLPQSRDLDRVGFDARRFSDTSRSIRKSASRETIYNSFEQYL